MAIIVEDGTVIASAESYITLAAADTYFTAHDDPTAWTGLTDALKESALKYATRQLDGGYTWTGSLEDLTQVLAWPRSGAYDNESRSIDLATIPQAVKDAQCELALFHADNPINTAHARGGKVLLQRAGPVAIEYEQGAPAAPSLPIIARLLNGLGKRKGSAQGTLERA